MLPGASTFLLDTVRWNVFGTLTFRHVPARVETVAAQGLCYLEECRKKLCLNSADFYWYLRPEAGESGGRWHLHVVLRVPPKSFGYFVVPRGCLSWAHTAWGRGLTRFRAIRDGHDPAVLYIAKQESCGADNYELAKTSRATHGIPSEALLRRAKLQKSAGMRSAAYQSS